MKEFFGQWYGVLAFALFATIIVLLIITVNYKWFFKRALDVFISLICAIVTCPIVVGVIIAYAVRANKDGGRDIFAKTYYIGKNGKPIYSLRFNLLNKEGKTDGFGKKIKPFASIPAIYDVLFGRFSFIGPMPLPLRCESLITDEDFPRFKVRPGLINPLVLRGENNTRNYEKMFRADKLYVKQHGLFRDTRIFFVWLFIKIRGSKKNYIGVPANISYAEYLLEEKQITKAEYDKSLEGEKAQLERIKRRKQLKKRMTNYRSDD